MRNRPWKASENVCCVLSTCKSFNIQIIKFDSFRDPKDFKRHPLKEQGQGYITSSAIEALLADESGKQRQRKKRYIYCEGEHWSDECLRYPNIEVRKNKLKNRCFTCVKKIIKESIVKYRRSHACTAERIENIIGVYAQRSFE